MYIKALSGADEYKTAARTVNARLKICLQFLFYQLISVRLSEAKHLGSLRVPRITDHELLRFAQNDTAYGSNHAELHSAGFADHVLIPRRVPNELHIGFINAVDA